MRITRTVQTAAVLATAALAITLAGCSAARGGTASSADQTLNISVSAPPSNFQIGNWSGGEAYLFTGVYDTIFGVSPDGTIQPGIAKSWKYNDDRTQLTLTVRDGMTFSDGTPVDANAVAASLNAARKGTSTSQNLSSLKSVDASGHSTVVLALSAPDAALVPSLAGTVGAVGAPSVLTADSSKTAPVGSGPYILDAKDSTVGSEYILKRNPHYWNLAAYPFHKVDVRVLADATAARNALLSGQIDVIGTGITADTLKQFPASKFSHGENKPVAFGGLWLVDRKGAIVPALADERVRKAINLVFNRDSIAKNLTGQGSGPTNQVFSPAGDAYSKSLLKKTPFNVAEAKTLMTQAGYKDGFSVTMPSTVVSTTFEPTITQSLGEIGIKVTWQSVPFQDFYAKVFGGNYGMFFMYNGFSGNDAQDLGASVSGVFNPFNDTTPELAALVAKANSAKDADQGAAFEAVNAYLVDQSWYAPLTYSTGFWVADNKVKYTPPAAYATNLKPFAPATSK